MYAICNNLKQKENQKVYENGPYSYLSVALQDKYLVLLVFVFPVLSQMESKLLFRTYKKKKGDKLFSMLAQH